MEKVLRFSKHFYSVNGPSHNSFSTSDRLTFFPLSRYVSISLVFFLNLVLYKWPKNFACSNAISFVSVVNVLSDFINFVIAFFLTLLHATKLRK